MGIPTIAVFGATGAQGGGLVRAIAADPVQRFRARAITRNPDGDKARALAGPAVELCRADADDPASLVAALAGADAAFCVTNFWEHFSPQRELAQAGAMAQAARAAGVRHLVWSTLEDTRLRVPLDDARMPTLMGRYKVPHFDAKAEADALFEASGVPTTFLLTSFYWDNLIHFGMGPKPGPDGELAITLPMGEAPLPGIAAEDIGRCAYGIFRRGAPTRGERIAIAGGQPTCAQMAASLTRALGRKVRYQAVPPDVYRGFGFPGADDLGNMFQYKHDFSAEFCAPRDVAASRALNPQLLDFDGWLAQNAARIPLA
jgi:uncharacterized protein YbjT (DUF2867 family)